jgi:acyl carrier protein
MSLDLLDLVFRCERRFGVHIDRDDLLKLFEKNDPPDILVGDLYECVRIRAVRAGTLDDELDAEAMWPMFREEVSGALGVDPDDITKASRMFRDLGAE